MRLHVIAPLLLCLAACATPEPAPVVAAADPNAQPVELECHQESSMGSNMIHKVCTRKQTDAERAQTQQTLRDSLPNASLNHQAAGSLTPNTNR